MPATARVHLILDGVLIADRLTQYETPREWYVVAGETYDVVSYVTIREDDGSRGFDVRVTRRS